MKYYLFSLHEDTYGMVIGPFNTIERACAYMKKHHFFGYVFNKKEEK